MLNKKLLLLLNFVLGLATCTYSQVVITGGIKHDSAWTDKIYISRISDFNRMFTASYEMLVAESDVDSSGNFHITIPAPEREALYRAHRIKRNDPVSTLIIGSKDENHVFFIAKASDHIIIQASTNERPIQQNLVSGSVSNTLLNQLIFRINNDTLDRESINAWLLQLSDTSTSELVSWMAIHHMFNLKTAQKDQVARIVKRLDKNNPYGNRIFEEYRTTSRLPVFILLGVLAIAVVLISLWAYQKRLATKIIRTLSQRERDVARLMITGKPNKEIAASLNIELSTVKTHVNNIYAKLNLADRKDLSKYKRFLKDE